MTPPLADRYGRIHRSLRLSVTDRCNLRCPYCMPAGAIAYQPRSEILSYEELETLTRVGVGLGIQEVRVTGGEPLVRRGLPELIRRLAGVEGLQDLSLTTNGFYLESQAQPLRQAGLDRINISLDTLRRDRFRALCGGDGLERVLAGLREARRVGLDPIKVNVVLMKGLNDDEIMDLCEWGREEPISLRFIELMPIGGGSVSDRRYLVPGRVVRARIEARYPLLPRPGEDPSDPARTFVYADGRGEVGFINPVTEPFCGRCDRVRITADGKIRNCLFDNGELDLRGPLRLGASTRELEGIWREAVHRKGIGGCLELGRLAEEPPIRRMWQIGG